MYQRIVLVGNLGGDPEMRYLPDGQAVTNFSIATNRKWNDRASGEQREETIWWRISVFGAQAETCNQYLSKGRQVLVEGRMRPDPNTGGPRIWQRQDGTYGASYEMTAFTVRFLGGRQEGGLGDYPSAPDAAEVDADGIPF
ncbi:MAG: single-stranded DNA-binding protein [Anaerolineales bacterium]|nr:single-stranded DNA-binding protein [Anaerolineales bacterium]